MPELVQLGVGLEIRVEPPAVPVIRAAPPVTSSVAVVPVTGPPGPRGEPGGGAYVHHQAVPQAVWLVEHGFGHYPVAWSLFDAEGALCGEYQVEHLDLDTSRISMETPTAGTLRLI